MIACAQKTVSLAISEKLNSTQRLQVCTLDQVDVLITELTPSDEKLMPYAKRGITIL
jgi:DeoR/GlpR family transcriptional regulator of sugar metabolism